MTVKSQEWKTYTLRDLCERIDYGYTASAKKEKIGPKFLRITDIVPELIDWSSVPFCDIDAKKYDKYKLQLGDIVIARTGATSGYAKRINKTIDAVFASYLVRLRIKKEFDNQFIGLIIESERYKQFIKSNIGGAAQPQANAHVLTSFPIKIPPLDTQREIASILSAYDDLIENNTRRIKILEGMAQSLYREWFINFRFPGHEKTKFIDSPLGKIPKGWQSTSFSELLESFSGGSWGSDEPNEKENHAVKVIRGTDFKDLQEGNVLRTPTRFISDQEFEKKGLTVGDIVVENSVNAKSRCVGSTLLITVGILERLGADAICASFCKNFRLINPSLAPLVYLHLKHLYIEGSMEFYQHVATNGIGNFQAKRFVASESLFIPAGEQLLKKILETFYDFTTSIYADQIDALRHTRDFLLPELISGPGFNFEVQQLTGLMF